MQVMSAFSAENTKNVLLLFAVPICLRQCCSLLQNHIFCLLLDHLALCLALNKVPCFHLCFEFVLTLSLQWFVCNTFLFLIE